MLAYTCTLILVSIIHAHTHTRTHTHTNTHTHTHPKAALVASSMILIQHTELMSPKAAFYRQHYAKVIGDKHEHTITKFGAILAQGIVNAGGCNVTISLQSRSGHMNMKTAVGLLVFSQFWFWYPLCHFLSLAFTPTELITLNADLKVCTLLADFVCVYVRTHVYIHVHMHVHACA